ncbi:MAG: hypothetical protein ACYS9Y_00190 [Planctomycetota bacterium]|jgi:hypothetical protein
MFITHSYLGTTREPYRYLFFLLLEDYIEAQTQFVRELDLYLERFARSIGDSGAFVRPFTSDIDTTKNHVLYKNWTNDEKREITKTPGMLMINIDFDKFDPQKHPWIHLCFGERLYEGISGVYQFGETLGKLAEAVCNTNTDVFEIAHDIKNEVQLSDAAKVFEEKPGIFGFSIDLVKGSEVVSTMLRRWAGHRT